MQVGFHVLTLVVVHLSLSLCQTHLSVSHVAMTTVVTPTLAEVLAHCEGMLWGRECCPDDPMKLCCGSAVILDGLLCSSLRFPLCILLLKRIP